GGPGRSAPTGGSLGLAPRAAEDEPLVLSRIAVIGRFDPAKRRLDIEHADVGNKDVGVAASGYIDFSTPDPRLAIGAVSRNMSIAAFKQMWPVFVNTPVRDWALEHFIGGSVEKI